MGFCPFAMKLSHVFLLVLLAAVLIALGWGISVRFDALQKSDSSIRKDPRPAPVLTAPIERAPIALQRAFSGTLEAHAEFVAAPKVGGVIERLSVNLGDDVTRRQVVAELDDAEFVQDVAQAEAELEVARANLAEAESLLKISERELERIEQLGQRGLSSASQTDAARADQLARKAHVRVTQAQLTRAAAQLAAARIRHAYTEVRADWHGDDGQRVVAERYVDEGETVSANAPLLKIVRLDPITAVIHVTEKEYAGLQAGQPVNLQTDAYPGRDFAGVIARIAPVFREATRQARIEVEVANPDLRLKPGMFVRARVVLKEFDEAVVVPLQALTRRDGEDGLFVLAEDGHHVHWRPVQPGIQQDGRLQVSGEGLQGQVVILGQQLLDEGSKVLITEQDRKP